MVEGRLELRLFGGFQAAVDGVAISEERWSRKKAKTLVKLLALQPNHEMFRDPLMETLWPEQDAEAALNNFNKTLHAARRALEPDLKAGAQSAYLAVREQRVQLTAPGGLSIDAVEFERAARVALEQSDLALLEAALAGQTGDLLPEDRYEDWSSLRREQLARLGRDVRMRLASLYESHGRPDDAIRCWQALVQEDRVNEPAYRALMRLHASGGQRHLALEQYKQCVASLRAEVDAEPEPATTRLYEKILAGEFGGDGGVANSPGVSSPAPAATAGPRRWIPAVLAIAALAIGAAWYFTRPKGPVDSIAVLPLQCPGAELDYLCDGLTEGIISRLSEVDGLRVMARSTMFAYKSKSADPRAVGRETGVRAVLTGRLVRQPETLAASFELVDASDGALLLGDRVEFAPRQLARAQAQIIDQIATGLRLRLEAGQRQRIQRAATASPDAYREYLLGRHQWNLRTDEGFRRSLAHYQEAIRLDPGFALAYGGLADSHGLLGWASEPPAGPMSRARAMAQKALSLDGGLGEAHASLGMVHALYDWDWAAAEASFRRAIALNPSYATAHHWYGVHLCAQRRFDEAKRQFEFARRLDPLSPIIQLNSGYPHHYQRQFPEAMVYYRKALELSPAFAGAFEDLALAHEQQGQKAEAAAMIRRSLETDGKPDLAQRFAAGGLSALAAKLEQNAKTHYVSPAEIAQWHARAGDLDRAFHWLDRALEERSGPLAYLAVDPRWDGLRADPRFAALLGKVGLKK